MFFEEKFALNTQARPPTHADLQKKQGGVAKLFRRKNHLHRVAFPKKCIIFAHSYSELQEVAKFSQYKIALRNFSNESQTYDFQLDNEFFKHMDGAADIQKGSVKVSLVVKKTPAAFEFSFDLQGLVYVPCDRCLDEMPIEVNSQNRLFVKFGKEFSEESDEIVIIPEEEGEINVVWFIYEFVALSIPMKRIHPPGKCNKIMTSKLNKYKPDASGGGDEDEEVEMEGDAPLDVDPRWDSLKDLNLED